MKKIIDLNGISAEIKDKKIFLSNSKDTLDYFVQCDDVMIDTNSVTLEHSNKTQLNTDIAMISHKIKGLLNP